MPARRLKQQSSTGTGRLKHGSQMSEMQRQPPRISDKDILIANIPDANQVFDFTKDEIVWAKMKFYSAWPAKVRRNFSVKAENYLKKKMVAPKVQVEFFDNPPTIGDIHHNQIFKFVENFAKFSKATNKKLQYGIYQAEQHLIKEDRQSVRRIRKSLGTITQYEDFEFEDESDDDIIGNEEMIQRRVQDTDTEQGVVQTVQIDQMQIDKVQEDPQSIRQIDMEDTHTEQISSEQQIAERLDGTMNINSSIKEHFDKPDGIIDSAQQPKRDLDMTLRPQKQSSSSKQDLILREYKSSSASKASPYPKNLNNESQVKKQVQFNTQSEEEQGSYSQQMLMQQQNEENAQNILDSKIDSQGGDCIIRSEILDQMDNQIIKMKSMKVDNIQIMSPIPGAPWIDTFGKQSVNQIDLIKKSPEPDLEVQGSVKSFEQQVDKQKQQRIGRNSGVMQNIEQGEGSNVKNQQSETKPQVSFNQMSPISQKSKRVPKHTKEYMQFVKEQTHSKRTQKMKNKEKQRERNAVDKSIKENQQVAIDDGILHPEPVIKDKQEKVIDKNSAGQELVRDQFGRFIEKSAKATSGNANLPPQTKRIEDNQQQPKQKSFVMGQSDKINMIDEQQIVFDKTPKQVRKGSETFMKGITKNIISESNEREKSVESSHQNTLFKKKSTVSSKKGRKEQSGQLRMIKQYQTQGAVASSQLTGLNNTGGTIATSQGSQKYIIREKIQKMKEIKKYFDKFFREIKSLNKDILNQNDDVDNILGAPVKGQKEKMQELDDFQKLVKKTYDNIHYYSRQIDAYIRLIFTEFNELSLIHESKLGHALRDMQQFLQYYQSRDENIQNILGKLDMLIEIQEKKMQIEIFGENPLDFKQIKKHFQKDKAKMYDSGFNKVDDKKQKNITELNRQMMSSEVSCRGQMTFIRPEGEQQNNEANIDRQSVCSDDQNNHPNALETSSQKQSMKDRKRTFRKMEKMNQENMKSKHKHRHGDSLRKSSSKGPRDKSGLYRGIYNQKSNKLPNTNSLGGQTNNTNNNGNDNGAGLNGKNSYSHKIQNAINQFKIRQKLVQMQQMQNIQQQLQSPQILQQNLQQQLLQNLKQQQLPQTQFLILNNLKFNNYEQIQVQNGQNMMNVPGNNLSHNQNMGLLMNSLQFQKQMQQQMQFKNNIAQHLGQNVMKQQTSESIDPNNKDNSSDRGNNNQNNSSNEDEKDLHNGKQAQESMNDSMQKQPKDNNAFNQMNWSNQLDNDTLKRLTEQLKQNKQQSDDIDFTDEKQMAQFQQFNQLNQQLGQIDSLTNLSPQIHQQIDPMQFQNQQNMLQQLKQMQNQQNQLNQDSISDSETKQNNGNNMNVQNIISQLMNNKLDQQEHSPQDIKKALHAALLMQQNNPESNDHEAEMDNSPQLKNQVDTGNDELDESPESMKTSRKQQISNGLLQALLERKNGNQYRTKQKHHQNKTKDKFQVRFNDAQFLLQLINQGQEKQQMVNELKRLQLIKNNSSMSDDNNRDPEQDQAPLNQDQQRSNSQSEKQPQSYEKQQNEPTPDSNAQI